MNEDNLKLAKEFLELARKSSVSPQEFKKFVEFFAKAFRDLTTKLDKRTGDIENGISRKLESHISGMEREMAHMTESSEKKMSKEMKGVMDKCMKGMEEMMEEMETMPQMMREMVEEVEKKIPTMPDELEAPEIRKKLESLSGDERLDKSAVKGLDEAFSQLEQKAESRIGTISGGRAGVQILSSGSKVGTKVNEINFSTGLSAFMSDGVLTVISLASGAVLTATGSVDGTNRTFTFTELPSYLVIDNASYRQTSKNGTAYWTWDSGTLTATLTDSLAPSDEIFGVK